MTIELGILISIITMLLGLYAGRRNFRNDVKTDTTEMTTVIVKLENIQGGITEIKGDLKNVTDDIKELDRRVTVVEQSTISAQKRIDELKEGY